MKRGTLAALGEWGLLDRLLPRLPGAQDRRFLVGPGDDAAVFRARPDAAAWAVTTDILIEGVHFDRRWTSPEDLGWKSLAVNLSDLAAMGGVRPALGVVAAGLPPGLPASFVTGFYRGAGALARAHGFAVAGGDTTRADKITVCWTVLGELVKGRRCLTRDGARPGDVLMATGTLGDAAAGLSIAQKATRGGPEAKALLRKLLRPVPRLDLAPRLAAEAGVTAMMDCSDGLWRSALLIAKASGARAVIDADLLPLSPALRAWAARAGQDARETALSGGEEYELVLTARPAAARRIAARGWAKPVGRIEKGRGATADATGRRRIVPHEFEHFG